jgi:integrase
VDAALARTVCGAHQDSGSSLRVATVSAVLDSAGRRRSPATLPGFHVGRPPRNKGIRYPADPPTVEEIIAVMRQAGDNRHGWRLRALIVVLWRGGLRIQEAPALTEPDLDPRRGSLLVRNGKGGRRREIGMDAWGWEQLRPWLACRRDLPVGPLFCVIDGPTRGRPWSSAAVRVELRRLASQAGVRRRFAPHQLRHAHALELAREGVSLNIIQRQLGHANLGTTSIYLDPDLRNPVIACADLARAPCDPGWLSRLENTLSGLCHPVCGRPAVRLCVLGFGR